MEQSLLCMEHDVARLNLRCRRSFEYLVRPHDGPPPDHSLTHHPSSMRSAPPHLCLLPLSSDLRLLPPSVTQPLSSPYVTDLRTPHSRITIVTRFSPPPVFDLLLMTYMDNSFISFCI
ncbi:hypothetical protein ACFE04_011358 [Oxalis oulophora]